MAAQMRNFITLSAAIFMLAACVPSEMQSEQAPNFNAALDTHLAAITSRDLAGLKATLTSGDDLNVIFPDGSLIPTTKDVVDFHTEWFKDKDWIMKPEVVKVIESSDMAMALVKYTYRDNAEGPPRSTWLVLVFKLEDGAWKLVHDQNTRIVEEIPK